MKSEKIEDATLSKRPIRVHNTGSNSEELARLSEQQRQIETIIHQLDFLIASKDADPHYQCVLKASRDRLVTIALRRMNIPVSADTLCQHAEIVGQFNERMLLIKELTDERKELERQTGILNNLSKKISQIWEKIKKG